MLVTVIEVLRFKTVVGFDEDDVTMVAAVLSTRLSHAAHDLDHAHDLL